MTGKLERHFRAWMAEDGYHVEFTHPCDPPENNVGGTLPYPTWKAVSDGGVLRVHPSINCGKCGLHEFVDIGEKPLLIRAVEAATTPPGPHTPEENTMTTDGTLLECRCGRMVYRPDSVTGRRQALRCPGCHLTLARCACPPKAATPEPGPIVTHIVDTGVMERAAEREMHPLTASGEALVDWMLDQIIEHGYSIDTAAAERFAAEKVRAVEREAMESAATPPGPSE